jgi:oligopeptide transport system substrate-binding protein
VIRPALLIATVLLIAGCDRRPDDVAVVVSVIGGSVSPASGAAGRVLAGATAQGLVAFDAAGGIEPALAERWIVTDDGRSFIFRLRDAEWADGSTVTANDVVASLKRATAPTARNPLLPYLTAIDEIVAMTPRVIEVRLKRPRPDLLKLFAQPELAVALRGRGGTGPFREVDGAPRGAARLRPQFDPRVAGEDEPGRPAPEDHVVLRGERAAMAILRFGRKQSDLVEGGGLIDWPLIALAEVAPTNIRVDNAVGLFGLAVTDRSGFLATAANRGAVAMAIDRAAVTEAFRDNWPASETLLPDRLDSLGVPAVPEWAQIPAAGRADVARARVALWRAPVRLRIALPRGPGANLLWSRLGGSLNAVGIGVERVPMDAPADLKLVDRVAPYDSARWSLRTACQPCGVEAAALIAAAREAPDLPQRAAQLAAADAMLAADVAFIPIARPLRWSLVALRLRNWTANPRAWHPLNHLRRDPK